KRFSAVCVRRTVIPPRPDDNVGTRDFDSEVVNAPGGLAVSRVKAEPVLVAQFVGDQLESLLQVGQVAAVEAPGGAFGQVFQKLNGMGIPLFDLLTPSPHSFAPPLFAFAAARLDIGPRRARERDPDPAAPSHPNSAPARRARRRVVDLPRPRRLVKDRI